MRSKTLKLNGRANTTCSICGKRLPSAAALRAHKNTDHATMQMKSMTRSGKSRVNQAAVKRKRTGKTTKQQLDKLKSDIVSSPLVVLNKNVKTSRTSIDSSENATENKPSQDKLSINKSQFECPQCNKSFPTNFSALKHIQKTHCINTKGESVSSSSKEIVKPIRTETCNNCEGTIYPPKPHTCSKTLPYVCSGCNKNFGNVKLFDIHISKLHHQGLESLFFPSSVEFTNWKDHMEMQTSVKYSLRGKYENKQYYGCTATSAADQTEGNSLICLCPSAIVTQEFVKGVQAHFYPQHNGHAFKKFILGQKFKNYSISSFMESTEVDITNVKADDNDLYIQFKTLMESIVLDSAKMNIDSLRILVGKALEMTSVLNNYNEDDENENKIESNTHELVLTTNRSLSDIDISKALEGLRSSTRLKRKPSVDPVKGNEGKTSKEIKARNVLQLNKELAKVCADLNDSEINEQASKGIESGVKTGSDLSNNKIEKIAKDVDVNIPSPKRRKLKKPDPVSQKKHTKSQKEELEILLAHKTNNNEEIQEMSFEPDNNLNSGLPSTLTPVDITECTTPKPKEANEYTISETIDEKVHATLKPKDIKELTQPQDTKDIVMLKPKDIKELMQIPTSFNDSYKEFVEQCKGPVKTKPKNDTTDSVKKQTLKTKTQKLASLKRQTSETITAKTIKSQTLHSPSSKTLGLNTQALKSRIQNTIDNTSTLDTLIQNTPTQKTPSHKSPSIKALTIKTPKAKPVKKKVLKTKMGHFTPNSSPKKRFSPLPKPRSPIYNDLTQIPLVKTKQQRPKILKSSNKISSPSIKSKPDINEASPKFMKQIEKSWTSPKKSLTSLQSPISKKGSYITNIKSPKHSTPNSQPVKNISLTSLTNIKIDRYEVKEQENDCNILILKI